MLFGFQIWKLLPLNEKNQTSTRMTLLVASHLYVILFIIPSDNQIPYTSLFILHIALT
jgi:hypothetical protein